MAGTRAPSPLSWQRATMPPEMACVPLVLVPGLMCDAAVWAPLQSALAACARCQIADHGDADSITVMAQQVLDGAPAEFALAGHSMGARVALEVVRLAPARVLRLALLDTGYKARPGGSAGENEARQRFALLEQARREGVRAMALQWVQGMLHPQHLQDGTLVPAIIAMFGRKSADVFARQITALLARPDAAPVLAAVRVPTLVLCGRQDSWAPVAQHEEMHALLACRARLHVVEQAGHMSPMEQPGAVAQAMLAWLRTTAG